MHPSSNLDICTVQLLTRVDSNYDGKVWGEIVLAIIVFVYAKCVIPICLPYSRLRIGIPTLAVLKENRLLGEEPSQ